MSWKLAIIIAKLAISVALVVGGFALRMGATITLASKVWGSVAITIGLFLFSWFIIGFFRKKKKDDNKESSKI